VNKIGKRFVLDLYLIIATQMRRVYEYFAISVRSKTKMCSIAESRVAAPLVAREVDRARHEATVLIIRASFAERAGHGTDRFRNERCRS